MTHSTAVSNDAGLSQMAWPPSCARNVLQYEECIPTDCTSACDSRQPCGCLSQMWACAASLWLKATSCRCVASRELLKHHQKCQSTTCAICVPVKQHVQQQRVTAQRKQQEMLMRQRQGGQGGAIMDNGMQACLALVAALSAVCVHRNAAASCKDCSIHQLLLRCQRYCK